MTLRAPWSRSFRAAWWAEASSRTAMPVNASASYSLGVRYVACSSNSRGKGAAGAGSKITGTPASVANCAARHMLASGTSSCNITMSAPAMRSAAWSASAGVRAALAPEATEIKFSPAVFDENQRHAGVAGGITRDEISVDSLTTIIVEGLIAERVLSHFRHESDVGAKLRGRDCLIGSLPTGRHDECAADHRFARPRQLRSFDHHIGVHAADDDNLCAHRIPSASIVARRICFVSKRVPFRQNPSQNRPAEGDSPRFARHHFVLWTAQNGNSPRRFCEGFSGISSGRSETVIIGTGCRQVVITVGRADNRRSIVECPAAQHTVYRVQRPARCFLNHCSPKHCSLNH